MNKILMSVVMPTYNSSKTLNRALQSISNQTFSSTQIEILIIDGGSTDSTKDIAKRYGCTMIDNPKIQPEFAKHLGIINAKGKYCVFLDSDEVLTNNESFQMKYNLLEGNLGVKNVLIGGLKNPPHYPFINEYASRIGDPFSYFMYGVDAGDYIQSLEKRFQSQTEEAKYIVYHVANEVTPICDGGGHFFDLSYLKDTIDITDPHIVSRIFDVMVQKTHSFAIMKNDFVAHYSNTTMRGYLNKINWRIINNIHYSKEGITGFSEREQSLSSQFIYKKYLFVLFSLIPIWPFISSLQLLLNTQNILYLFHFFFSIYTALFILIQYFFKLVGIKPSISHYR